MTTRRTVLGAGLALPFVVSAKAQAAWPERTVRIIVPYPPAGSTDVLTRIIALRLQQKLGQSFVIENRAGAGGNIGMDAVAQAAPDGYTFGAATIGHYSINQYLYASMPWDIDRDFETISLTWELPNVAAVSAEHNPARTLQEFIAWAKAQRSVSYGSPGVGTTPHLSGALFTSRLGITADHVPFRGAAQTIPAMLSGDVGFVIDNLASYVSFIQSGRIRALAVTSAERWPTMPDIPTMAEAGVPDFVVTSWATFVAPARTPRPIIERMNAALREVAAEEAVQRQFLQGGARILWSTPEAAVARGRAERPMWQEAVRISGARTQ
jgi:tripartite-type tricarboxylate transporter receptor subunit TctC